MLLTVVEVSGNGNNGVLNGGTKVTFSNFLHLDQDHGRDFFRSESLGLTLVLNLDHRKSSLVDNLEGPVLHISLNFAISETTTNKTLGIENGVEGVHGNLVLGSITNQTLAIGESDVRRGGAVTLQYMG